VTRTLNGTDNQINVSVITVYFRVSIMEQYV